MATLTISSDAIVKAGALVGSVPPGSWDTFIEEAEGVLSGITKYNLVENWLTISANSAAPMLSEYCARSAAIQGIAYNMLPYSRPVAQDMINVHAFMMNQILETLEADGVQEFMGVNS